MNTDELTLGQLKELKNLFANGSSCNVADDVLPFDVGDTVLIRTVTMIQVGKVVRVGKKFIQLENAGWVADTGRFGKCLSDGSLSEFERAPTWVLVNKDAIVDLYPWEHEVPFETK
jgi:hypothetical protein